MNVTFFQPLDEEGDETCGSPLILRGLRRRSTCDVGEDADEDLDPGRVGEANRQPVRIGSVVEVDDDE